MAVETIMLNGSAFILEDDELSGSGFFVGIYEGEFCFTYFVTAAHVVWSDWRKRAAAPPAGSVTLRVNRKGGGTIDIILDRSTCDFHADRRFVDMCAFCIDDKELRDGDVQIMNISTLAASSSDTTRRIPPMELMLGDEVFITGAFWPRLGEKKNIPIVRTGNIAALCDEPIEFFSPRHAAYLIETRSLGGISGSPVWFDPNSRQGRSGRAWGPVTATNAETGKSSEPTVTVPYRFVGMVVGTWSTDARKDFVHRTRTKKTDADWNTGISVVIPDCRILEFLMSRALKQKREQAIVEREKKSRVRFTSSSGS